MRKIEVQEATVRLQEHGSRYASMINYLHMTKVEEIVEGNGVMIARFQSDDSNVWVTLAADTPEQLQTVQEYLQQHQRFAAVEGWMYPFLVEGRDMVWDEPCYTYYVPDHVTFPPVEPLPEIPLEHAITVQKHWVNQEEWSFQFIVSSIKRGFSSMKFFDGKPVAWAAMQDDGAMGFMHVLPEYRRHGYAKEVTIDLIRKYRQAGRMPFVHIVRTNQASIALTRSMGFELLKEIYWLEVQ